MRRIFLALALGALIAVTVPATSKAAGFTSGNLEVQVTLAGTCGVSNTSLNFGLQVFNLVDISGVGSVDVVCTIGTDYSVDLSGGAHFTGGPRRMYFNSGGAGPLATDNFITYNLYTDAAHTHIWGSCCGGTNLNGFVGNGAIQHQPVYGLIPTGSMTALQAPGTYTDTVIVSVTF